MSSYRFSLAAESDLEDIAAFTIETWDHHQADRYVAGLEMSHVVFFRKMPYGVRIIRILHERMQPELRSFDDQDE